MKRLFALLIAGIVFASCQKEEILVVKEEITQDSIKSDSTSTPSVGDWGEGEGGTGFGDM